MAKPFAARLSSKLRNPASRALLAYLLLAALFYLPQLLGLRAFPDGDFNQHFLPFSLFWRSELLAGRLPIWNPYTYAGHPFLADVQAAVFYPVSNLVLALTLPFGSPAARLYFLEVEVALHLALAGFFTFLLVRELTGRSLAAFLAGCVFAFSGYLTGYPPLQLAILRTAVWLPLILWLLLRGLGRPGDYARHEPPGGRPAAQPMNWRWMVYAALAYTAAFLAGHPQTFLYLSYAVAAWIVLLVVRQLAASRGRVGATLAVLAPRLLVFAGVFLALSAGQLWPSLEFTTLSVRANVDYAYVNGGYLISDTWQVLVPNVLTAFSPLYAGIITLGLALLALAGLAIPRRATRRPAAFVLFFALLAVMALLASYGGRAFLYPLLYRWLPGWNLFRGQERAAYLVALGASVLAGYGAAIVEESLGPAGLRRAGLAFAALATAGVATFALLRAVGGQIPVPLSNFWVSAGIVLAVAYAAAIVCLWTHCGPVAARGLLVLALIDLFLANCHTNLGALSPAAATRPAPAILAVQAAVAAQSRANPGLPPRTYNEYRVYDDYGMAAGVEEVGGSSPLRLAHFDALLHDFPPERLWQLAGVQSVLTWAPVLNVPSQVLGQFPGGQDATYLHQLTLPHARAWIAPAARAVDDATARALLADRQKFDPDKVALLAADQAGAKDQTPAADQAPRPPARAAAGADQVRLARPAPAHLTGEIQSQAGGWLVISENWLPGWEATRRAASGTREKLPVVRADLAFLAIRVPPGASSIDLVYRPASVRYGLAISAAAALVLLVLGVRSVLRGA